MALRELLASFDLSVDDKQLKSAHSAIEGFKKTLGTVAVAVAGAFSLHAVTEFLGSQIKLGAELDDQAQRLGVNTDELQRFQYAAKLSGVEIEGANHALMHLNRTLGEAILGNAEAQQTFSSLGVNIKDTQGNARELSDIVPDLADAFEKLKTPQEQTARAMAIFGKQGAALLPLLKGGKEGVSELYKKFEELGGGLAKGFVQAAAKADDEIDNLHFATRNLESQLSVEVLPTITDLVKWITKGVVYFGKLARETNVLKVALYALLGVSAAIAAVWALIEIEVIGPILLAVAAFGLLFLIAEDIFTLFTGGNSLIGKFIDKLFGVGSAKKAVEGVKDAFNTVIDVIMALEPNVKFIGELLSDIWTAAKPLMKEFFGEGTDGAKGFFGTIRDGAKEATLFVADLADTIGRAIYAMDGIVPPWLQQMLGVERMQQMGTAMSATGTKLRQVIEKPTLAPGDAGAFYGGSNRVKGGDKGDVTVGSNNQVTVNVTGGKTNGETGNAVAKAVRGILTQADLNAAHAAVTGE